MPFQQRFRAFAMLFPPFVVGKKLTVIGVQQNLTVLIQWQVQRLRHFHFAGRPAEPLFQLPHHLRHFTGMATHAARYPVTAAQLIEHGAANALHRIGGKGGSLQGVITLNGV
ncbi:hypothetical protein D3C79_931550 [compost metagenome]